MKEQWMIYRKTGKSIVTPHELSGYRTEWITTFLQKDNTFGEKPTAVTFPDYRRAQQAAKPFKAYGALPGKFSV